MKQRVRIGDEHASDIIAKYQSGDHLRKLAAELGVTPEGVAKYLRRHGCELRQRGRRRIH